MKTIDPANVSIPDFHGLMLSAIAPRPIAFASTVDAQGAVNLSPYSFFNAFGSNPPTLIFSPARRVRNNTTKHTLENVLQHKEVVINIVSYAMVEQMSLASTEYEKGVNEFTKAGFTEVASERVSPPRVAEAPAAFECVVKEVIHLGNEGGAGNLIICQVVLAHFKEEIFDDNGAIDPNKLDTVARMGGNWYCRASGSALFDIPKPLATKGIGVDQLPQHIRESHVLSGNNLGRLGNTEQLPSQKELTAARDSIPNLAHILERFANNAEARKEALHLLAKKYIEKNEVSTAWKVLLQL